MEKLEIESFYRSKRVLVTGNTGFKGGWLSLWLSHLGAEVKGFSLKPPTNPSFFKATELNSFYETINGDVRDYNLLSRVVEGFQPEIIFHLAAQPLVRYSHHYPLETFETNVMGTTNLLEASKRSKVLKTIINVTSDKCYENKESNKSFNEDDRLGGNDPYSSSKACAELVSKSYAQSYFQNSDIKLATVRAGNVIGGGDWAADRLVPDIYRALKSNAIISLRNPHATRPWQHVLEPVWGYLTLAKMLYQAEVSVAYDSWNFGPNEVDIKSVEWIVKSFQEQNPKIKYKVEKVDIQESQNLRLDISKAKNILNWHPRWNMKQAVRATNEWFQAFNLKKDMVKISLDQISEYRIN